MVIFYFVSNESSLINRCLKIISFRCYALYIIDFWLTVMLRYYNTDALLYLK
jgi:hypothetical protein